MEYLPRLAKLKTSTMVGRSPKETLRAIRYFKGTEYPKFAAAYLGRGVARYQLLDRAGAIRDAKLAEKLF